MAKKKPRAQQTRKRKRGRPKKGSEVMAAAARIRASKLTAQQRHDQAVKAANARWDKARAAALQEGT